MNINDLTLNNIYNLTLEQFVELQLGDNVVSQIIYNPSENFLPQLLVQLKYPWLRKTYSTPNGLGLLEGLYKW
jgi:hypothetical protein